jgi:hypothetical protein
MKTERVLRSAVVWYVRYSSLMLAKVLRVVVQSLGIIPNAYLHFTATPVLCWSQEHLFEAALKQIDPLFDPYDVSIFFYVCFLFVSF